MASRIVGEVLEELEDEVVGGPLARAGRGCRRCRPSPARRSAIQPVASDCSSDAADGQVGTVDRADVVEPEEAALEEVGAVGVLEVHPPREVDEQLVEDPAEEVEVAAAVDGEHLERGPRLHGRVDVAEVPLVRGQRAVRVLEPLPAQQHQLVLGERGVEVGQGDAVEGHVPRREPRVLPLVGHRHDVEGVEVLPSGVALRQPVRRRRRLRRIAVQPARARRRRTAACSRASRRRPGA